MATGRDSSSIATGPRSRHALCRCIARAPTTSTAPALRVNRDEPGALTDEQEAYAGANLTPRDGGARVPDRRGLRDGQVPQHAQFAARRQAAGSACSCFISTRACTKKWSSSWPRRRPALSARRWTRFCARVYEAGADLVDLESASSLFHDVSAGGPAYSAQTLRRALRISEETKYKGTLAKHIRQVLNAFIYSADTDIPDINHPRFYRVQKVEAAPATDASVPRPRASAVAQVNLSGAGGRESEASFAEVAKCFQLRTVDPHSIDWMRRGLPAGRCSTASRPSPARATTAS